QARHGRLQQTGQATGVEHGEAALAQALVELLGVDERRGEHGTAGGSGKAPMMPPGAGHNRPMALKSTIYKAQLALADMDRGVYADHSLTLALHPSETEERLMIRLLAYALRVPADDRRGRL